MKSRILKSIKGTVVVLALALGLASFMTAPVTHAQDYTLRDGIDGARSDEQPTSLDGNDGVFKTIVNILLFIIGAIAVIMLVIGGIRYTISNGDSNQVTSAKNTILYAVIGLIVAILAYAVVNFVVSGISGSE